MGSFWCWGVCLLSGTVHGAAPQLYMTPELGPSVRALGAPLSEPLAAHYGGVCSPPPGRCTKASAPWGGLIFCILLPHHGALQGTLGGVQPLGLSPDSMQQGGGQGRGSPARWPWGGSSQTPGAQSPSALQGRWGSVSARLREVSLGGSRRCTSASPFPAAASGAGALRRVGGAAHPAPLTGLNRHPKPDEKKISSLSSRPPGSRTSVFWNRPAPADTPERIQMKGRGVFLVASASRAFFKSRWAGFLKASL